MICPFPIHATPQEEIWAPVALPLSLARFGLNEGQWNWLADYHIYQGQANVRSDCYFRAAEKSALYMLKERNLRRADAGKQPLVGNFYDMFQDPQNPDNAAYYFNDDFFSSLQQFLRDDYAEQTGAPFLVFKSQDGITPFSPSRIAEWELRQTYRSVKAQEEEALRLLERSGQSAAALAQISATQTVTDPVTHAILVRSIYGNTVSPGAAPPGSGAKQLIADAAPPGQGTLVAAGFSQAAINGQAPRGSSGWLIIAGVGLGIVFFVAKKNHA